MKEKKDKLIMRYFYAKDKRIKKIKEKMQQDNFNGKRIKGIINAIRNLENDKIEKISEMLVEFKRQNMPRIEIENKIKAFAEMQDKLIEKIIEKNNIKEIDSEIDLKEVNLKNYVVLTKEEKALLVQELLKNENIFKLQTSKDIITQMDIKIPVRITKHKQFTEYIQKREDVFMNYFKAFIEWEMCKFYNCIISSGNFAWIAKDDKGTVRYFSKNPKTNESFGFNIFDLIELRENIEIGTSLSFKNARRILARDLNIAYKEREWEHLQEEKYINNIKKIERAFIDMKRDYPNLYKLTENYLHILEHLNAWAMANIGDKKEAVNGEAVFFCSLRHAERFVKRDHSVISKAINLFAVLGLITKVHPEKVSENMLVIAREISKKAKETANSVKNVELVNFYSIPLYNVEVLMNAEKMGSKLIENKITNASRINKKEIEKIFGKVFVKKVYPKIETIDIYSVDNMVKFIERGL